MRDWQSVWGDDGVDGIDWDNPETYFDTLALLARRGGEWLDCLLQLADRQVAVSELAGERFIVEALPTAGTYWTYTVRGVHSRRVWRRLTLDTRRAVDDLVLLALIRISLNGRQHTNPQELEALSELLGDDLPDLTRW